MDKRKSRSLLALDALNFCNAGIQTGLGPFMSIYYASARHWNPGKIGILLACQSLSGVLVQAFVGSKVDESRHKRLWTGIAGLTVSIATLAIVLISSFALQVVAQLVIGLSVTVIPAATSAFALGLVEQDKLTGRIARNEALTHTGNLVFAATAGVVGTWLALKGIFYAAALFASGMTVSVWLMEGSAISYEAARAGTENSGGKKGERTGFLEVLKQKRVLIFTSVVVLFYFSNASTLPLVGELLTGANKGHKAAAWQIAACVVVAEAVMIAVAAYTGKFADSWGRKPLFLIAFAALAVRNALSMVNHDQFYLIALQAFDGIAAAIYGVLLTLITADLAKGTGRFNFLQGSVQSAMGLGGFLSYSLFGWIAKAAGYNSAFLGLSLVAVTGGLLYAWQMPETKPEPEQETHAAAA